MPEDGGLINQALIGLKPVNACVHTYTKPQTSITRSRGLGWRIHESVEDTKLSTNKQHSLSITFASAAGVLSSSLTTLVAVVATVTFCSFGTVVCVRFYLSALIAFFLCQAKSNLRTQQSRLEQGVDQRHIFQKVGGVFSSHYAKDSVNRRKVENAGREVESLSTAGGKKYCGFSIPDLGSNAGTWFYDFWALIWESL